jgi:hypothetical protein
MHLSLVYPCQKPGQFWDRSKTSGTQGGYHSKISLARSIMISVGVFCVWHHISTSHGARAATSSQRRPGHQDEGQKSWMVVTSSSSVSKLEEDCHRRQCWIDFLPLSTTWRPIGPGNGEKMPLSIGLVFEYTSRWQIHNTCGWIENEDYLVIYFLILNCPLQWENFCLSSFAELGPRNPFSAETL